MHLPRLLLLSLFLPPVFAQQIRTVTPADRARASEWMRLVYATFDPLVGVPDVEQALRSPDGSRLQIVQYVATPSEDDRRELQSLGGELIGYLPDNAYVVRIDSGAVAALRRRARVRWVGAYHPAYRLEPVLREQRIYEQPAARRYFVVVADKHRDKPQLVQAIAAIGGRVDDERSGSLLLEATLTGPQLLQVAGFDEVLWIDRWSEVGRDMDNARIQGGADYVEAAVGYTGAGVNAHVYEGIEANHADFTGSVTNVQSSGAADQHGHATAGIVFGNGNSNAAVRGLAPDCGKYYTEFSSTTASRWQVFDDLVNIHDVSHTTASWGNLQTSSYTSISAESDDIVLDHDLAWTQSQSNTGTTASRPQAWAKNVFSIGAVAHNDNSNPGDDSWAAGGASIGPAADGRFKPTLCAYYDFIGTSDLTGAPGYSPGDWDCCFGGTSGATPIVAGYNVLAIQMFTDDSATPGVGRFGNALRVPGGTVHENRPHFTTLKALQVVSADQYSFTAASSDNRREHQGWGFPNIQNMWDRRGDTFIVDETSLLQQGQIDFWQVTVAAGEPSLKISLNWAEPGANPAAAQTLVNDLSLYVIAPDGTQYWGNNGLDAGVWSTPGGVEDSVNSIENVFVDNPLAGDWYVQVIATSVVADNHAETQATDVDYALVAVGGPGQAAPQGVFADWSPIGAGCDGTSCIEAIYEYPTFDLANSSFTLALENGNYALKPGAGTWIPPSGSTLAVGDNGEVLRNVGFSLPYPGGSTSTIRICANGWISEGSFVGTSNIVPTVADFLQNRMWAVLWRDLNPAAGGSVWFDSSPNRCVVSWVAVPNFFANGSSTFQVQFWNNGDVHFIYQNINVQGDYLVGFNDGGIPDPGPTDISANLTSGLAICSNAQPEMSLSLSDRPILGTTIDLVTDDVPAGTSFGLLILASSSFPQPVPLTALGMAGCELYQPIDVTQFWGPVNNQGVFTWPLPSAPALAGVQIWSQSASFTPGINAFGFAVSNGVQLDIGTN